MAVRLDDEYLIPLLSAYWLRPATGMWRSVEASFFDLNWHRLHTPSGSPSWVDLGVGDGLFSTIATGLEVDPNVDAYLSIADNFESAPVDADSFIDVFDVYGDEASVSSNDGRDFTPLLGANPETPWKLGVDHKLSLLSKAATLGSFGSLRVASLDDAESIFDANEKFDLVFSNSLYWSNSPKAVLGATRHHVRDDALLALSLQLTSHKRALIGSQSKWGALGHALDRGRSRHYGVVMDSQGWLRVIRESGFEVCDLKWHASPDLVFAQEWLDQRETYLQMALLANSTDRATRLRAKRALVDHMASLARLANSSNLFDADETNGTYLLVKARAA